MAFLEAEYVNCLLDNHNLVGILKDGRREMINSLLRTYSNVFSGDINKPISGYILHIPVKQGRIFRRSYDIPFHLRETVKKEIDKLQQQCVLIPTDHIEWATPLVTVRKKNNDIRLCLDLKQTLNKVRERIIYPLPKIEDILNSLPGAKSFTILDFRQAYLQLQAHPKSQQFLGVNTP